MKLYMDCMVCKEKGYWVIRDITWNNRLVARLTDAEYSNPNYSDFAVIRDWCKAKAENPEWLTYKKRYEHD